MRHPSQGCVRLRSHEVRVRLLTCVSCSFSSYECLRSVGTISRTYVARRRSHVAAIAAAALTFKISAGTNGYKPKAAALKSEVPVSNISQLTPEVKSKSSAMTPACTAVVKDLLRLVKNHPARKATAG